MKKFIAILTCLILLSAILPLPLFAAGVPIDAANFPDPVFREYVKNFDLDKTGTLSETECTNVKELWLDSISSADGIKNFTQVERIFLRSNNLTVLDLSKMSKLSVLQLANNNLEKLNLSGCSALFSLDCQYNRLIELNLSGCVSLTRIECNDNRIKQLDLTGVTQLEGLFIFRNQIASLDLSTNEKLQYSSLSPQSVLLQKTLKNGKWTADLGALVGKENLSKIIWCSVETIDASTGIMTFESEPMMFMFTYQTGVSTFMEVKVNLYKGSAPVIKANNISFTQRSTPFDLKSEPGLNLLAYDPVDGELTSHIQAEVKVFSSSSAESQGNAVYDIIPAVNTNKPGRYTITYTVNDNSGNTVSLDVFVYVWADPALISVQSSIPSVNSDSQPIQSYKSSMNSTSSQEDIPTPPMGAQNTDITLVLALILTSASAILIAAKRRNKAK